MRHFMRLWDRYEAAQFRLWQLNRPVSQRDALRDRWLRWWDAHAV